MNKDILMRFFDRFAIITTVIFLFSGIFIAVFWGTSTEIHLSYVFAVLIISFVLSAIYYPIEMDEKMSRKKRLVLNILYFLIVNVSVAITGFYLGWFTMENKKMLAGFEFTILAVYAVIMLIMWFHDKHTADKMNDRLRHISCGNQ